MSESMERPASTGKSVLDVLTGREPSHRPIWLMRQAGRYLPEYLETRKNAGSFLDLCYAPELAAEVTLQPIRRFSFDAAIIFADILLLPHALGQRLEFLVGEGPVLEPITSGEDFANLSRQRVLEHLNPVFEALKIVRGELADDKTLIGFCGAPWTVATYMIAGKGTPDQRPARAAAYENLPWFGKLIDLLCDVSIDYLCAQIEAGADAVQIFDTWAGILTARQYDSLCIEPTMRIVRGVREKFPDTPIIGFPRGSGVRYEAYVRATKVDGVGLDWAVPLEWAGETLAKHSVLQGNLDPIVLATGGDALDQAIDDIVESLDGRSHIFNLGHGILPDTPIANVERLVDRVRSGA